MSVKFVTLRELKINPSKVLDRLSVEDLVVTRRGKPAAALLYLDEESLDEFVLARHPKVLREVDAAKAEYLKKGGIDQGTMRNRIERRRG
jgi:prevent-host-death family protein